MNIEIYSKGYCPYCHMAKDLFKQLELEYTEYPIDGDLKLREEMIERSGRKTVPQIFFDKQHIGGFDDLNALYQSGKLQAMIDKAS